MHHCSGDDERHVRVDVTEGFHAHRLAVEEAMFLDWIGMTAHDAVSETQYY